MIKELITLAILTQLKTHYSEEFPQIYYVPEAKMLTYDEHQSMGKMTLALNEDETKELIGFHVEKELKNKGKVYLYTCRDNYLIAFEDIEDENDEELDLAFEEIEEAPGLLIGFD